MKAARASAGAAALLISSVPAAVGAAPTCADVLKKIEKKMADTGIQHPDLRIVPKNLARGRQVMASCENGTQRIVYRAHAASGTPGGKHGTP